MKSFAVGDAVRTRARGDRHTRLPHYLARKRGTITAVLGEYTFPDDYVRDPKSAERATLYTVAFDARDVFSDGSAETICADLFEPYLEAAE